MSAVEYDAKITASDILDAELQDLRDALPDCTTTALQQAYVALCSIRDPERTGVIAVELARRANN
ncbi:MAG: hypothetical protein HY962_07185 [Ignavibacteriae bacterium]|nr:hypothetical protein [Ignavibacteriota bacterium]